MHATLHIGTAKTGTTSMQHFLRLNRSLLAQQGCLYPRFEPGGTDVRGCVSHNYLCEHPLERLYPPLAAECQAGG